MKAVILESYVMEEGDLDWSGVKALVPELCPHGLRGDRPPHWRCGHRSAEQVPHG